MEAAEQNAGFVTSPYPDACATVVGRAKRSELITCERPWRILHAPELDHEFFCRMHRARTVALSGQNAKLHEALRCSHVSDCSFVWPALRSSPWRCGCGCGGRRSLPAVISSSMSQVRFRNPHREISFRA